MDFHLEENFKHILIKKDVFKNKRYFNLPFVTSKTHTPGCSTFVELHQFVIEAIWMKLPATVWSRPDGAKRFKSVGHDK